MPDNNSETLFEQIKTAFGGTVQPVVIESLRILPDSVVLGTAVLAGISYCKSYGVLLLTMFELMLIQRGFSMIISGIAPVGAGSDALQHMCEPGFTFPNSMRVSLLETIGTPSMFPSPTIFFLTGILAYMIGAMQQFGREIKSLFGELQIRTTVATACSFLFTLAMLMFRYSYGCESFGTLLVSLILGSIVGMLLVFQNQAVFGRDGINVLNIPMIQTALEKGKPMYVCAPADI